MASLCRMLRSISFLCLIGFIAFTTAPPPLQATDALFVTVTNTTGSPAADLHVTFSGTGGDIYVDPWSVNAPGCPLPVVLSNPPVVTSMAVIDWGIACVLPGETVMFVAYTANGPLGIVSAFWTDTLGGIIGPGSTTGAGLPLVGSNPFAAIKYSSIYVGGNKTYTRYKLNRDQFLRVCCRQKRWCYNWVYFCPLADRFSRFFEIGPWYHLAKTHSFTDIRYTSFIDWVWGINPPSLPMPKGPPPSGFGVPGFDPYDRAGFGLDPRFSNDGGRSFRQATDFTSAFMAFVDSLTDHPSGIGIDPPVYPVPVSLMRMGARYVAAAGTLTPLLVEIDSVRVYEPSSLLDDIHTFVQDVQQRMADVGNMVLGGSAPIPVPIELLSLSLTGLSNSIELVDPSPRFANAAASLRDAAAYADTAASYTPLALGDTVAVAKFGYALDHRVPGALMSFAQKMWTHIVVKVDLGQYAWYPSTIDAAQVIISDAFAMPLDTFPLAVSDLGEIVIPTMDMTPGAHITVWFKLPTFLSVMIDIPSYSDGRMYGPYALVGGDANNDDCVSLIDIALISANIGQGGWGAISPPPPSDVTGDGIVDPLDANLAFLNLGNCGPIIVGVDPRPAGPPSFAGLRAFPNPSSSAATVRFELPAEGRVTVRLYNVRGEQIDVIADRLFPAGEHDVTVGSGRLAAGVYFVHVQAPGIPGVARPIEGIAKLTVIK